MFNGGVNSGLAINPMNDTKLKELLWSYRKLSPRKTRPYLGRSPLRISSTRTCTTLYCFWGWSLYYSGYVESSPEQSYVCMCPDLFLFFVETLSMVKGFVWSNEGVFIAALIFHFGSPRTARNASPDFTIRMAWEVSTWWKAVERYRNPVLHHPDM